MVSRVTTVLQGSVGTTWSMTSFGEPWRGPKLQQQRNQQQYYEVTISVQTVSRLYRGSKKNCLAWNVTIPDSYAHLHLPTTATNAGHTADKSVVSKTQKYQSILQTHCSHRLHRNSWRKEQPSKRIHQRTWETYYHYHRESQRDIFQQICWWQLREATCCLSLGHSPHTQTSISTPWGIRQTTFHKLPGL